MTKYKLNGAIYTNREFEILDSAMSEKYGIYFKYVNSFSDTIKNGKFMFDFILIDTQLKISDEEYYRVCNTVKDKNKIKFITQHKSTVCYSDLCSREDYENYFFELRKRQIELESKRNLDTRQISNILKHLGLEPKMLGYTYIKDCIIFTITANTNNFERDIYPKIARKYNVSTDSIKRCMNNLLYTRYDKIKMIWRDILNIEDIKISRPKLKKFILTIKDKINKNELHF